MSSYTLKRDSQELSLLYRHPFRQRRDLDDCIPTDDRPVPVSSFFHPLLQYVKRTL